MPKSSFDQYVAAKARIDDAQAAVKTAQGEARGILRTILDAEGKGPHEFGGKKCIIVDRRGILCVMASARPRVVKAEAKEPKAPKEPKAAKEPKATKVLRRKASSAPSPDISP